MYTTVICRHLHISITFYFMTGGIFAWVDEIDNFLHPLGNYIATRLRGRTLTILKPQLGIC